MPSSPPITNDFVASILLREAQTRQSRATKEGVYAFLSEPDGTTIGSSAARRKHNGPKPNARFLQNLVREVDSHNTALLEKEAEESSKRLRRLEGNRHEERRSERAHGRRERSVERRWEEGEVDMRAARRERIRARMEGRGLKAEGIGLGLARETSGRRRRDDDGNRGRRRDGDRDKGRRRHRSRTRSPSRSPSRSRTRTKSSRTSSPKRPSRSPSIGQTSPPLPVKTRGRGRTGASQIDAHFDANYNPMADILPDPTPDNPSATWDSAVAAYRDRARFKQLGMEKLKESGLYSEEELKRWENGAKEEGDYKWAKKGEGREWDRGKVLDKEGKGWSVMPGWGKNDLDY